ncbi:ankyrin repeat protein [Chitinophaga dinghuensis]|uniref:Ankyrin repeat protein n=1 Tax=Chitinophaga dinghuensis TaxID=1539050 RepID=A0A327W016_9BACT|nr:ankyrin repeat domain-containing protein [Chitinophaga dinghuensis]RAJ80344.1 ankyrin repeat protein [Chitinophaga dinghuensis]
MKLFGPNALLTEHAQWIMQENIAQLEMLLEGDFDINAVMHVTQHVDVPPVILALAENKLKVLEWLLAHQVQLNHPEHPAIVIAASNCKSKTVQLLLDAGADVNIRDRVGKTALHAALYGKKYDTIPLLLANGYNKAKDGKALRQAVFNRLYPAIQILLDAGFDVNFHQPDMVFPYNPSAVCVAAQNNDFSTVKLLVAHGADVSLKDNYGERAFNAAVAVKNEEMIAFIRALEPAQWHNEEQRLTDLKSYKMPEALIQLLRSENRRITIPDNDNLQFLEFHSILDVKEVNWKKHKFLDLVAVTDNYSAEGFLVWYPKKKCLAYADYEHETFTEICTVKEFLQDPGTQINKIFL